MKLVAAIPFVLFLACFAQAAQDRISESTDVTRTELLTHSVHPCTRPESDGGPADPSLCIAYATLLIQLSPAQQAEAGGDHPARWWRRAL